ncbi:MAG: carboxypeptidase-like regulatory domain-containing protein, partial [Bradyrhizobiaceae bacterium]|nr:carboxypeptidase-like regulatory domain-containing protein [Bradyrhizobiaceae bacterium]
MKSKSSYSSIGRLITLCVVALSCLHTPVAAQNVQLGKVVDATTGDAIGGASVRVLGTTRGTYTRGNGTFRLPVESGMTQILVRSIGYRDTTCSIAPSQTITIKLLSAGV